MRRALSLIIWFHLLVVFAAADSLWLISSDNHAFYEGIPDYIHSVSKLSQDFLEEYPDGTVILGDNGDQIAMTGKWTSFATPRIVTDYGKLSLDVRRLLAHYAEVYDVVGNHEEFDSSPGRGQEAFFNNRREYLRALSAMKKREHRILAGNLPPGEKGKRLFAAYTDIPLHNGSSIRVVGGVLDKFWAKTNYDLDDPFDIFSGEIFPLGKLVKQQLIRASVQGKQQLVFALHAPVGQIEPIIGQVEAWKESLNRQAVRDLKIPLWLGGHQHKALGKKLANGSRLFQPGSHYDIARVHLNDNFEVVGKVEHYGASEQREIARQGVNLRPFEQEALHLAEARIREIRAAWNSKPVIVTNGIYTSKEDLKTRRELHGIRICEMFRAYAEENKHRFRGYAFLGTVAFFNPSGWKLEGFIEEGTTLIEEDFNEMSPFAGSSRKKIPRMGLVPVSFPELQLLYRSLRHRMAAHGTYSPQTSMNIREVSSDHSIEVWSEAEKKWIQPSASDGYYLLAMDHWLFKNPEALEVWEAILRGRSDYKRMMNAPVWIVLRDNAAKFNCPDILAFASEHGLADTTPRDKGRSARVNLNEDDVPPTAPPPSHEQPTPPAAAN